MARGQWPPSQLPPIDISPLSSASPSYPHSFFENHTRELTEILDVEIKWQKVIPEKERRDNKREPVAEQTIRIPPLFLVPMLFTVFVLWREGGGWWGSGVVHPRCKICVNRSLMYLSGLKKMGGGFINKEPLLTTVLFRLRGLWCVGLSRDEWRAHKKRQSGRSGKPGLVLEQR